MVLERRPVSELAQLLNLQLKDLRAGRLMSVEQWLAMRKSRAPPDQEIFTRVPSRYPDDLAA